MLQTMITSKQRHNRTLSLRGFTFIELLVVLTIIAVMVTIVVPYANRSNKSLNIKQESLSIAEALKYMADLAMDTKKPTRIVINPKANSFLLEMATEINNQSFRPIEDFGGGGIHYFVQNVRIIGIKGFDAEGDGYYLIFDPTKPWPNGSISLSTTDSITKINIKGKQIEIEDSTI
jgi:prepilin-type N-terminal cleavage/methylation domain-containing protein